MIIAYYARPMTIYGTPQVKRDEALIRSLGYEPIDIETPEIQHEASVSGMSVFETLVGKADILFFRAFPDGTIGAGVAQEIAWANSKGIPVLELPTGLTMRARTVDQTREYLRESGQR